MRSNVAALFLIATALQAQTRITGGQVRCPAPSTGNGVILMAQPGPTAGTVTLLCVQVDKATLVLDTTTSPPTLRSTAAPAALPVFVDGEAPAGAINGTNTVFTLAAAPSPAASLLLHRNGLLQSAGSDFTLAGATITFLQGAVPQTGDTLDARYRR